MKPESATAALKLMWTICDKPERLRTLHLISQEPDYTLDAKTFWSNFWQVWTTSENLHEEGDFINDLIAYGETLGSSLLGLDDDERDALAAMPKTLTIYRGCADWNEQGWSWSTDFAKAKWFAERALSPDGNRMVVKATVSKSFVLGFLTGRNESEIVIDPEMVSSEVVEQWNARNAPNAGLMYAIHSGRFGSPEADEMRAEMMAATVNAPFEPIFEMIDTQLAFMDWASLNSKRGYMVALRKAVEAKSLLPARPVTSFQM